MNKLNQFIGLKVVALLMIFYWHSAAPQSNANLGARACELFFLISGFLYLYNHKHTPTPPTFRDTALYVKKKLLAFWPLHLAILCYFLISGIYCDKTYTVDIVLVSRAVLNAMLLQSWSSSGATVMAFNGKSWFLSCLVFCYFCAPFLCRLLKNSKRKWVYLPLILIIRYCAEILPASVLGNYHVYSHPIIRCIEFFLGMLIADFYFCLISKKSIENTVLITLGELFIAIYYIYWMQNSNGRLNNTEFLVIAAVLVFIYSLGKGVFSKILSIKPFLQFGKIQFEFYMLHGIGMIIFSKLCFFPHTWTYQLPVAFIITVLMCVIYNQYIKKPLTVMLDKIITKVVTWLLAT